MLSFPIVHLQGVSSMKKQLFVAAALIAFASSGIAQDKHTQVTPDAVIWKDNPAFPKGVQVAALVGDQTKAGDRRLTHQVSRQLPNAPAHSPLFRGCNH